MSFIDKLLGKNKETDEVLKSREVFKVVSAYSPVFCDWRGEIYESMLVRAAIDARARHVSKLKVEFRGTAKPDLTKRLSKRPNPWDTWSKFLYRVSTILDCCNNVILVPIYDDSKNKIGIFPLIPTACKVVKYKNELWLTYKFYSGQKSGACRMTECAILNRFQFKNDFFGEDNKALDETMDLIHIEKQSIKEAIKTTSGFKFWAKSNNFSMEDDLATMADNFSERNFGSEAKKSTKVLLFPNTMSEIHTLDGKPYTPDKEQMELIQQNVYTYFGVNLKILQNSGSSEELSAFYEGFIEPFGIQFSETLTFAVYSDKEVSYGSDIVVTSNRLQYMTFTDKKNFVEGGLDRGILTIDEAREVYNLPPLPDGKGNRFVARGEYYFIQEENEQGGNNNADQE